MLCFCAFAFICAGAPLKKLNKRVISVTFLIAAVLNLCAVSYDRLKAIVMPLEGRITIRGAKRLMLVTWLASLVIAAPFAYYRKYKVSY